MPHTHTTKNHINLRRATTKAHGKTRELISKAYSYLITGVDVITTHIQKTHQKHTPQRYDTPIQTKHKPHIEGQHHKTRSPNKPFQAALTHTQHLLAILGKYKKINTALKLENHQCHGIDPIATIQHITNTYIHTIPKTQAVVKEYETHITQTRHNMTKIIKRIQEEKNINTPTYQQ